MALLDCLLGNVLILGIFKDVAVSPYYLGLVDKVCSSERVGDLLKEIAKELRNLKEIPAEDLVDKRYEKFRKVGY